MPLRVVFRLMVVESLRSLARNAVRSALGRASIAASEAELDACRSDRRAAHRVSRGETLRASVRGVRLRERLEETGAKRARDIRSVCRPRVVTLQPDHVAEGTDGKQVIRRTLGLTGPVGAARFHLHGPKITSGIPPLLGDSGALHQVAIAADRPGVNDRIWLSAPVSPGVIMVCVKVMMKRFLDVFPTREAVGLEHDSWLRLADHVVCIPISQVAVAYEPYDPADELACLVRERASLLAKLEHS